VQPDLVQHSTEIKQATYFFGRTAESKSGHLRNSGFFPDGSRVLSYCHSERSEESRVNFGRVGGNRSEMFHSAQHDSVIYN
jgi:hypothetical protein